VAIRKRVPLGLGSVAPAAAVEREQKLAAGDGALHGVDTRDAATLPMGADGARKLGVALAPVAEAEAGGARSIRAERRAQRAAALSTRAVSPLGKAAVFPAARRAVVALLAILKLHDAIAAVLGTLREPRRRLRAHIAALDDAMPAAAVGVVAVAVVALLARIEPAITTLGLLLR
jgi:hypothetical protein